MLKMAEIGELSLTQYDYWSQNSYNSQSIKTADPVSSENAFITGLKF